MGWKLVEVEMVNIEEVEKNKTTANFDHILQLKLSELAKRNIAIQVYSEILGCEIWLCSNKEMATQVREDEPGAVTYTVDELRRLIELNPDPEGLRNIHIAKSIFSGSKIIDSRLRGNRDEPDGTEESNSR